VTRRDTLFSAAFAGDGGGARTYEPTRDGNGFIMLRRIDRPQRAIVVFGWLDELRERMALAAKK
jgi:hypothetical protein